MDIRILAAIISSGTSILILIVYSLIFKPLWGKYFHVYKLEQEYRYEQRKKIKNILANNKIQLINSCEELVHRLWNLSLNYEQGWQHDGNNYYFQSFVFRFLAVCAWVKKTHDEMLFLDSTIATDKDMVFIKFLKLIPQTLCDVTLFDGFEYDQNEQKDHFFSNNLDIYSQSIIINNSVLKYPEFAQKYAELRDKIEAVCHFIDGVSPGEDRLRWDRLQLLNNTLMVFINAFGYDFQNTTDDKFKEIINKPRKNRLIKNYINIIKKNKLSNISEFKSNLRSIASI